MRSGTGTDGAGRRQYAGRETGTEAVRAGTDGAVSIHSERIKKAKNRDGSGRNAPPYGLKNVVSGGGVDSQNGYITQRL